MTLSPETGRDLAPIPFIEALRRAKRRHPIRADRLVATGSLVAALLATIPSRPAPRLIWNASASAPIGLYRLHLGVVPRRGDRVAARFPASVARVAALRGYVPLDVPVVKTVVAVPGDRICALSGVISVNAGVLARTLGVDRRGRALPRWHGCRTLAADHYLLLNADVAASFDGRYFGPSLSADIIGTVTPLWLR